MSITSKTKKWAAMLLATLFLLLGILTTTSSAWSLGMMADYGPGFGTKNLVTWKLSTNADYGNRKYNMQEMFDISGFSSFTGIGDENFFVGATPDKENGYDFKDQKEVITRGAGARFWSGLLGNLTNWFSNILLMINDGINELASSVVKLSFSSNIFCDKADSTGCIINLPQIVGGTSTEDTGIVGSLFTGVYFPLILIGILGVAIWVIINGLAKRKFRETFGELFKVFCILMLTAIFAYRPATFVEMPSVLMTEISGVMLGSLSDNEDFIKNECVTSIGDSAAPSSAKAESLVESLTCQMWSTFHLNVYTKEQFGLGFDNLYTYNPPKGADVLDIDSPLNYTYCVNMYSSLSPRGFAENLTQGKPIEFNDGGNEKYQVCNIAAAHLAARAPSRVYRNLSYAKIEDVIYAVSQNDIMLNSYESSAISRSFPVFIGIITSIVAYWPMVKLSLLSLSFRLGSTLMLTLAPVVLLFGVVPGKPRKLLKSWLGDIASNIFKYVVSFVLLLITLMLYSSMLSNVGIYVALLIVIVVSYSLNTYYKELIELLGTVDFGGTSLQSQGLINKTKDKLESSVKEAKNTMGDATKGYIGGGLGSKMAGGDFKSGASEGLKRSLKRKNSFVGNAVREADRMQSRQERDEKEQEREIKKNKAQAELIGSMSASTEEQTKVVSEQNKVLTENANTMKDVAEAADSAAGLNDNYEKQKKKEHLRNKSLLNQNKRLNDLEAERDNNRDSNTDGQPQGQSNGQPQGKPKPRRLPQNNLGDVNRRQNGQPQERQQGKPQDKPQDKPNGSKPRRLDNSESRGNSDINNDKGKNNNLPDLD